MKYYVMTIEQYTAQGAEAPTEQAKVEKNGKLKINQKIRAANNRPQIKEEAKRNESRKVQESFGKGYFSCKHFIQGALQGCLRCSHHGSDRVFCLRLCCCFKRNRMDCRVRLRSILRTFGGCAGRYVPDWMQKERRKTWLN